jgi:signal peptidase II
VKLRSAVLLILVVIVADQALKFWIKTNFSYGPVMDLLGQPWAKLYAGALGNLIDSLFYGMLFSESTDFTVAQFLPAAGGYAGFLHGKVVDMLYFPMVRSTYPSWMPFFGGKPFEFFSPIFNIADAAISVGVITLLLFQKRFFRKTETHDTHQTVPVDTSFDNKATVM